MNEQLDELIRILTESHNRLQTEMDSLQLKIEQIDQAIKNASNLKILIEQLDIEVK